MSKPLKRGGRYYVRRRIPLDLVAFYGRNEFQKALNTSDRTIANMMCAAADMAYNEMFARDRAALARSKQPQVSGAWEHMQPEEWGDPEENSLEDEAEAARCDRVADAVAARLQAALVALGLAPTGTVTAVPVAAPIALAVPVKEPLAASVPSSDKTWDRIATLWEKARQPQSRTVAAVRRTVARFEEFMGGATVPRTTKQHIADFRDKLLEDGYTKTTTAAALSHLHNLANFAVGQVWIETNPATGVKVERKKGTGKAARPPFDVGTLNRIFANRVYTDGVRPHADCAGDATYWLPLLGLYTGARIEELCQLHPEDVYEEAYRDGNGKERKSWVVRIVANEDEGQGVKNAYSSRRIPLHPELIRLGFVEFANSKRGGSRIFPGLRPDQHGIESSNWSKWWLKHIRKECAPASPKMVFHSFRHLFKDVCRDCGISKEHADALQGHSDGDTSDSYGGEFFPLRPLVDAISRYTVHGIKLPAPLVQ